MSTLLEGDRPIFGPFELIFFSRAWLFLLRKEQPVDRCRRCHTYEALLWTLCFKISQVRALLQCFGIRAHAILQFWKRELSDIPRYDPDVLPKHFFHTHFKFSQNSRQPELEILILTRGHFPVLFFTQLRNVTIIFISSITVQSHDYI